MRKIIDRVTYNTLTAEDLGAVYHGEFGDPSGYEERLFKTNKGAHFLYGTGGGESKYPEPTILPITNKEATEWKKSNKGN